MAQARSTADLEYAVMLAILNFHSEYMKSTYAHVDVQLSEDIINVTLTRMGTVPAEARLAQSEEGRALLRQVHEALFTSCQEVLTQRIESVVERKVRTMVTSLDPASGKSHIAINLQDLPIPQSYPTVSPPGGRTDVDHHKG